MHVCIISPEYPPSLGGVGTYVNKMSFNLIKRGFSVSIITRGNLRTSIERPAQDLTIYRTPYLPIYPFNLKFSSYFIKKIVKELDDEIDLINIHSPGPMFIETNLPLVSTVHISLRHAIQSTHSHDLESKVTKLISPAYIDMEDRLIRNSKVISAVSKSIASRINNNFPDRKIKIIGNGVDTKVFLPKNDNDIPDPDYLLYTGRLHLNKGILDLIDAYFLISKVYPELKLIITGKGSFEKTIRERINKYKLGNVSFAGMVPLDKLIRLYQNASIYILPSYFEGLPTSLLEAMSCGSPCIATQVDGSNDIIEDGKNGLLVPPRRPDLIAKKIEFLLENSKLRRDFGKNARRYVIENHNWDRITDNIIDVYNESVNR